VKQSMRAPYGALIVICDMKIIKLGSWFVSNPQVLQRPNRSDIIFLNLPNTPSPFPKIGLTATIHIEAQAGYGKDWLIQNFGFEESDIEFCKSNIH